MPLNFSTFQLMVENQTPSVDDLKAAFVSEAKSFSDNKDDDAHYLVEAENIKNNFFWLYARHGNRLPYTNKIFDISKEKELDNPRKENQVETRNQFFILYSVKNKILCVSNANKRNFFETYLKKKLNKDIIIKSFYKNIEEFIDSINSIGSVRFATRGDALREEERVRDMFAPPKDMHLTGIPAKLVLEMQYKKFSFKRQLHEIEEYGEDGKFGSFLKKIGKLEKDNLIDSLVCIGYDEENFESKYNMDDFRKKISVKVKKDDNGLYEPTEVRDLLIEKIKGIA